MIDLYTAATPTGHKISIALEELALPYEMQVLSLSGGEQMKPAVLALFRKGLVTKGQTPLPAGSPHVSRLPL